MNKFLISVASMAILTTSCTNTAQKASDFDYNVDRFADIEVLRYKVPGFEDLSLNQKKLIYFLNEAALQGRDILFDQMASTILLFVKLLKLFTPTSMATKKAQNSKLLKNI